MVKRMETVEMVKRMEILDTVSKFLNGKRLECSSYPLPYLEGVSITDTTQPFSVHYGNVQKKPPENFASDILPIIIAFVVVLLCLIAVKVALDQKLPDKRSRGLPSLFVFSFAIHEMKMVCSRICEPATITGKRQFDQADKSVKRDKRSAKTKDTNWLQESKNLEAMNRKMLWKQAALKAGRAGTPPSAPRPQPQRDAATDLLRSQLSRDVRTSISHFFAKPSSKEESSSSSNPPISEFQNSPFTLSSRQNGSRLESLRNDENP
ncbi:hypothetical protein RRG08_033380 [Elysia crispata]|uniref:Uncharacterized protein n=1 Tax=Elysia crispata TaxID=231223 RepID=A0AAE1D719_9GAST|nr:hypothetical protein RRG08_033380 [Elysia crispata]